MPALEMCLGMEMSELHGPPIVLHGEGETILTLVAFGFNPAPEGGFHIVDHGASREVIIGALQTGNMTGRLSAVAQRCI